MTNKKIQDATAKGENQLIKAMDLIRDAWPDGIDDEMLVLNETMESLIWKWNQLKAHTS